MVFVGETSQRIHKVSLWSKRSLEISGCSEIKRPSTDRQETVMQGAMGALSTNACMSPKRLPSRVQVPKSQEFAEYVT